MRCIGDTSESGSRATDAHAATQQHPSAQIAVSIRTRARPAQGIGKIQQFVEPLVGRHQNPTNGHAHSYMNRFVVKMTLLNL